MTFHIIPRYEDNLWYPIIVKSGGGGSKIVELQGKKVNEWNDMVSREDTKNCPRGWRV